MTPDLLRPGDVLMYSGRGWLNWAIRIKTWSRFSHCEAYAGGGRSYASRNGLGVARYPFRPDVAAVYRLRPSVPFDLSAAVDWFESVDGQGYDWVGLLSFVVAEWQGRKNQKQFCSEFLARFYRAGITAARWPYIFAPSDMTSAGTTAGLVKLGLDPWNGADADAIAPSMFPRSPLFEEVA